MTETDDGDNYVYVHDEPDRDTWIGPAISLVNKLPASVEFAVVVDGTTYPYSAAITAGQDGYLEMANFEGLQSGAVFTSRVIVPSTGATNTCGAELTYASNASSIAIFTVTGNAQNPILNYEGTT